MKDLCHERPFGGKFDLCNVPSLDNLTYLIVLSDVHSPFHPRNVARLPSSCISGIQNPESYSLSSVAMLCFSRSSRLLDGRPGLRWPLSSASSSSWRQRYLLAISNNSQADTPMSRHSYESVDLFELNWSCGCFCCPLKEGYPLYCGQLDTGNQLRAWAPAYYKVGSLLLLLLQVSRVSRSGLQPVLIFVHLCCSHADC